MITVSAAFPFENSGMSGSNSQFTAVGPYKHRTYFPILPKGHLKNKYSITIIITYLFSL